jgi:hypothetical protein
MVRHWLERMETAFRADRDLAAVSASDAVARVGAHRVGLIERSVHPPVPEELKDG